MILSIVVAMTNQNIIGAKNSLPWYLPEDLKKFRKITTGHAMIMGRKTFESLPKVLPEREHYVITRNSDYKKTNDRARQSEHVFVVSDPASAIKQIEERLKTKGDIPDEVFIIGGGQIFSQMMPFTSKMYITLVKQNIKGDTFFPEFNNSKWKETEREIFDEFDFLVYEKI